MRRLMLAGLAALALSACTTTSPGVGIDLGSAPLAGTTVDNKGIVLAYETADTITTLVDKARDAGLLVKGTPRAKQVAGYLRQMATVLRAASAAQRAGDTGMVNVNLEQAASLVRAIRLTVQGG